MADWPFDELSIRPAVDHDAESLISLIGRCFAEYPGVLLDVDREEPDLREIASAYQRYDGGFWVVEHQGEVVGCIGYAFAEATAELRKLYVSPTMRKRGLGAALCAFIEDRARERGAAMIKLWSDTRFTKAHRLYRRLGYQNGKDEHGRELTRPLHDISDTIEYFFEKPLS